MAEFRELRGTGGGQFFKWPDGKYGLEFVGQFKALATGEYQGKTTFHAVIVDAQGKSVKVNTPTILRDKLTEVEAGEFVRIVYTGDQAGKGAKRGAKEFSVFAASTLAAVQAPAAVPTAASPAAPAPAMPAASATASAAVTNGVSADALAAAMALLQAQRPGAVMSAYDVLLGKLKAHDPKGSDALIAALGQVYPDPAAREAALRDHLKAQGVAA
jgi:hypothetical protein